MNRLCLEMPVSADTLIVGISVPSRYAAAINRAAELLRERHPKADDDEIMRFILLHGIVDVIDSANNERSPRIDDDDTHCAIIEAAL